MENEVVLFTDGDVSLSVPVSPEKETVWLNQSQMTMLYGVDRSVITKHIKNVFKTDELDEESNVQILHIANSDRPVKFYSLDVILSVGYRVNSKRGIAFRKWANSVLKQYILKGYAMNDNRLEQLGQVIQILKRTENTLDAKQVLSVIEKYNTALTLLDDYDHQRMNRPKGKNATYILTYEECRKIIDNMRFSGESDMFGNEKDDSFKGSIGNIYQTFGGKDIYPTAQEKAANLLYFVTKNHSFSDGNKRIAATMFLYFLEKNGLLYTETGDKILSDYTLVALTILIAESKPEEKEMMITVIMNCMGK